MAMGIWDQDRVGGAFVVTAANITTGARCIEIGSKLVETYPLVRAFRLGIKPVDILADQLAIGCQKLSAPLGRVEKRKAIALMRRIITTAHDVQTSQPNAVVRGENHCRPGLVGKLVD